MVVGSEFFEFNEDILYFYSPYNIVRSIPKNVILENSLYKEIEDSDVKIIEVEVENAKHYFFIKYMKWDSEFNGFPTYKLVLCLYKHRNIEILSSAVKVFVDTCINQGDYYFIEIPSEDVFFIQALNANGFKLIETRLNHFIEDIRDYSFERFPVRLAEEADIPALKEVASKTVNLYDRLHADASIKNELADKYLGTYIENAVRGFADAILVPQIIPKAFMVLNLLEKDSKALNHKFARLQLAAVDPELKGWYIKLASESIYYAKNKGANSMLVTTQTTNRAAFRSSEKQGFRLGSVAHVLSFSKFI